MAIATLLGLTGISACNSDYTVGYVYAPSASASAGLINAYGIDNQTGKLYLLDDSPVPSGGRNPIGIAAAPDRHALYVINHDDSTVVDLSIGTDGKLYPQNTYNTTGSFPTALTVSPDGKFLYVTYTYQTGFTTASPGPGGVTVFPIVDDFHLGPAINIPIGRDPVGIVTSKTAGFVYVVSQDTAAVVSGASQTSNLFAFSADPTSGALTLLAGQTINSGNVPSFGIASGQSPAGVIEDASGAFLYVTDTTGNAIISYSISGGVPTQVPDGSVATGAAPRGMTIDPSGTYLYVANYTSGTIGEYTFSSGVPVPSATAASSSAGTGTTCVTVEPSHGVYVYASGALSNSITGYQLLQQDGTLKPIIGSPYSASTLPTCAVSVPRY